MSRNDGILSFKEVSFEHGPNNPILDEVNFVVRRGSKLTLMGQNGAGKSTIFGLITQKYEPEEGSINFHGKPSIATARQVIPREELDLTVRDFFQNCFSEKIYAIDPKIDEVLEVVNLKAPYDRTIRSFSGGQQARLLLASALIQDPDILLLDEPTNNLDKEGIAHLTDFLVGYQKTCLVISHDADFLNAFTHGVLYLDVHTHNVEQYVGDYFDVVEEISVRIEKENRKNAQLAKKAQEKKDQANVFANKGGGMRLVAKRMRAVAEEMEEDAVDVRREDKVIRSFTIPAQEDTPPEILKISSVKVIKDHVSKDKKVDLLVRRRDHVQLIGPNGIGKTTLLESLTHSPLKSEEQKEPSHVLSSGVKVGYYCQDFSTLDFEKTPYETLLEVMDRKHEEEMRSVAAGFLITRDLINTKIGHLSEGQKGLVAFARLVLLRPGLLILDEPTNHINFRHVPVIAKALDEYNGAMIIVSHVPEFMEQIRIDQVVDLEKLRRKNR
ncbi:MAG: ATP-binding cassette domain-containing protein [Candidatus Paceibacterota bacterium]